jgi:hypothetical protein
MSEHAAIPWDVGYALLHNLRHRIANAQDSKQDGLMLTKMEMAALEVALPEWQDASVRERKNEAAGAA